MDRIKAFGVSSSQKKKKKENERTIYFGKIIIKLFCFNVKMFSKSELQTCFKRLHYVWNR